MVVGVVMPHQIHDPLNDTPGPVQACEKRLRLGGAQLLLILAVAAAVYGLGSVDADVVDHGGGLKRKLRMGVQPLLLPDEPGEGVDL